MHESVVPPQSAFVNPGLIRWSSVTQPTGQTICCLLSTTWLFANTLLKPSFESLDIMADKTCWAPKRPGLAHSLPCRDQNCFQWYRKQDIYLLEVSLKTRPREAKNPWKSTTELLSRENLAQTRKASIHSAWQSALLMALQSCTHHKAWRIYPINSGKDTGYLPRRQEAFAKDMLHHALEYLSQSRTWSFLPAVLIHMLFWDFRNVDLGSGEVCHKTPGKFKPQFRQEW